ncbi:MAG: DoxX family protein [Chthoniobacterales bacterium]
MIVLVALFGSLIVFRLLGFFFGVPLFQSWHESMIYALAAMFCFTAFAHFGPMRRDLERMVPPWVPNPKVAVFVTGILEILGAIGLIIPSTRTLAGVCLILFLVAVFPANVYATRTGATLRDRPVTPLGVRGPMQLLFILLIFWAISE